VGPVAHVGRVGAGLSSNVKCRILSRYVGREARVPLSHRRPTRDDSHPFRSFPIGFVQEEASSSAIGRRVSVVAPLRPSQ
jgi:hypothetical protein